MPKQKEFNIDDCSDADIRNQLIEEMRDKFASISLYGASVKKGNIKIWAIDISKEDLAEFRTTKKAMGIMSKKYEDDLKEKKNKYEKLKALCDFCLCDVTAYKRLIKNIDEFSYCSAISELEDFEKRYMRSKGSTKAIYRARAQEFRNIKC